VRKQIVLDKLALAIPHTIAFDMADWESYGLRPIAVAPRPDSILHPFIDSSTLESNLDFEIQEQLPDGSWPITWSWAFIDAAEWSKAEKEWKSFHTLNKLILFKAYGRLEVS
ncbi:MAG: hypothetical protein ACK2T3_09570, partial [Candidatus Promineifilaceae bacterium]